MAQDPDTKGRPSHQLPAGSTTSRTPYSRRDLRNVETPEVGYADPSVREADALGFGHFQPAKRAAECGPGWSAFRETLGIPLKKQAREAGDRDGAGAKLPFARFAGSSF